MKKLYIFLTVPVALIMLWMFTRDSEALDRGPHGGEIKTAGNYWIETKWTSSSLYTWLLDHNKRAITNGFEDCQSWLVYGDTTKKQVEMIPYGLDGYYGELKDDLFEKCIVIYKIRGEVISAEFENKRSIVGNETSSSNPALAGLAGSEK